MLWEGGAATAAPSQGWKEEIDGWCCPEWAARAARPRVRQGRENALVWLVGSFLWLVGRGWGVGHAWVQRIRWRGKGRPAEGSQPAVRGLDGFGHTKEGMGDIRGEETAWGHSGALSHICVLCPGGDLGGCKHDQGVLVLVEARHKTACRVGQGRRREGSSWGTAPLDMILAWGL